jgi:hypothetical protein
MTIHQQEILLITLAVFFYLWDSASLLHFNEGVLTVRADGTATMSVGTDAVSLGGRYLCIPNPFTPHRLTYRLSWDVDAQAVPGKWQPDPALVVDLGPFLWGIGITLFFLLPISLLWKIGYEALAVVVISLYLLIATMLAVLWLHRGKLELAPGRFASFAFEALACPPCALNLVRKIGRGTHIHDDLFDAGRRLLTGRDWERARPQLLKRVNDAIDEIDEDSVSYASLLERKRFLAEEVLDDGQ